MANMSEGGPMDSLNAWLAAMPVGDVERRITELERELALLRTLAQARQVSPAAADTGSTPTADVTTEALVGLGVAAVTIELPARLSRERAAILDVLSQRPERSGSPSLVGRALRERGFDVQDTAVQTTMSRMVKAGQLVRHGKGNYSLPPESATPALNGAAGGQEG
jgi:hypothetical protein